MTMSQQIRVLFAGRMKGAEVVVIGCVRCWIMGADGEQVKRGGSELLGDESNGVLEVQQAPSGVQSTRERAAS
jgi:hypothetical protein